MVPPAKKSAAKRVATAKKTVKSAKKTVKSSKPSSKLSGRIPSAARKVTRSKKSTKSAGTVEVVKPPLVDVTPEMKKDVVVIKPEPVKAAEPESQPVEKHEDFAKALTQEPAKKGFFSRLFGKKE